MIEKLRRGCLVNAGAAPAQTAFASGAPARDAPDDDAASAGAASTGTRGEQLLRDCLGDASQGLTPEIFLNFQVATKVCDSFRKSIRTLKRSGCVTTKVNIMDGILRLQWTTDITAQRRLLAAWGFVANARRGNDVLFDADAFGNCLLRVPPASESPCLKLKAYDEDGPHLLLMPYYFEKLQTWQLVALSATDSGFICEFVNMYGIMEQFEELREAVKFLFTTLSGIWGRVTAPWFCRSPTPNWKPMHELEAPDSAVWTAMTARQFFVGNVRTPGYELGTCIPFFASVLALDVGRGDFHPFAFFQNPDRGRISVPQFHNATNIIVRIGVQYALAKLWPTPSLPMESRNLGDLEESARVDANPGANPSS